MLNEIITAFFPFRRSANTPKRRDQREIEKKICEKINKILIGYVVMVYSHTHPICTIFIRQKKNLFWAICWLASGQSSRFRHFGLLWNVHNVWLKSCVFHFSFLFCCCFTRVCVCVPAQMLSKHIKIKTEEKN